MADTNGEIKALLDEISMPLRDNDLNGDVGKAQVEIR